MKLTGTLVSDHKVVSRDEWLQARIALLAKEKELTGQYDELSPQRRQLPWVKADMEYIFDAPHGKVTLADLSVAGEIDRQFHWVGITAGSSRWYGYRRRFYERPHNDRPGCSLSKRRDAWFGGDARHPHAAVCCGTHQLGSNSM